MYIHIYIYIYIYILNYSNQEVTRGPVACGTRPLAHAPRARSRMSPRAPPKGPPSQGGYIILCYILLYYIRLSYLIILSYLVLYDDTLRALC